MIKVENDSFRSAISKYFLYRAFHWDEKQNLRYYVAINIKKIFFLDII